MYFIGAFFHSRVLYVDWNESKWCIFFFNYYGFVDKLIFFFIKHFQRIITYLKMFVYWRSLSSFQIFQLVRKLFIPADESSISTHLWSFIISSLIFISYLIFWVLSRFIWEEKYIHTLIECSIWLGPLYASTIVAMLLFIITLSKCMCRVSSY